VHDIKTSSVQFCRKPAPHAGGGAEKERQMQFIFNCLASLLLRKSSLPTNVLLD